MYPGCAPVHLCSFTLEALLVLPGHFKHSRVMTKRKPLLLIPLQQACWSHEVQRVSKTSGCQPLCCNQLSFCYLNPRRLVWRGRDHPELSEPLCVELMNRQLEVGGSPGSPQLQHQVLSCLAPWMQNLSFAARWEGGTSLTLFNLGFYCFSACAGLTCGILVVSNEVSGDEQVACGWHGRPLTCLKHAHTNPFSNTHGPDCTSFAHCGNLPMSITEGCMTTVALLILFARPSCRVFLQV